jgi:hypothetical protein
MLRLRFRSPHPKERDPNPRRPPGKPDRQRSRMLEAVMLALCRASTEAGVRHCALPKMTAPRANIVATSFTEPGPKPGNGASSTL